MEAGEPASGPALRRSLNWLQQRQILEAVGDWAKRRPGVRPGGWAFQYANNYYPDVDDTAVAAMALHRSGDPSYRANIERATEWIIGMQATNGGWGAFDADNTHFYLNHIPFADHGALLDPPTADVTARCIKFLAQVGLPYDNPIIYRGLKFLKQTQESDGSWFGRWGTNYIYGTWSVLSAFDAVGEDLEAPHICQAVKWLNACQGEDGGWGEDCASYWPGRKGEVKASTPSQTAWALLGLMAAGQVKSQAVRRGIQWLMAAPRHGAKWDENFYTAVGFPRVFYLRYHGYSTYFPLWALARYQSLTTKSSV
jgi:squalene-hopene/tetraprenyl-beta-curcumene cyclase